MKRKSGSGSGSGSESDRGNPGMRRCGDAEMEMAHMPPAPVVDSSADLANNASVWSAT